MIVAVGALSMVPRISSEHLSSTSLRLLAASELTKSEMPSIRSERPSKNSEPEPSERISRISLMYVSYASGSLIPAS